MILKFKTVQYLKIKMNKHIQIRVKIHYELLYSELLGTRITKTKHYTYCVKKKSYTEH